MVDVFNEEQVEEVKAFDIPFVEDGRPKYKSETNAFNKTSEWKWEPPEEEEEILPSTALKKLKPFARLPMKKDFCKV